MCGRQTRIRGGILLLVACTLPTRAEETRRLDKGPERRPPGSPPGEPLREPKPAREAEAQQDEGPTSRVYWKDGFRLEHLDPQSGREYRLRLRAAMEFRYTYTVTDGDTDGYDLASTGARPGNGDDYSAFNLRRLRLYVDGSAPSTDWTYLLHLQLEPNGAVNAHDGFVQYQPVEELRIQFGRMKVPAFSLAFWQSGFKLNGTDRTIYAGDSENDRDLFGNRTYDFPSGNARLRVGGHRLDNGFATGGFILYRSQGLNLNGVVDAPGMPQLFSYAIGVFNGRDTRGFSGPDEHLLCTLRLGFNLLPGSDPAGPLGPRGLANYARQGDLHWSTTPLLAVVLSGFWDRQDSQTVYVPDPAAPGFMGEAERGHDIDNFGGSASVLFRYSGFSLDAEGAFEEFVQDPGGADEAIWDRWAVRANLGQFVIPETLEVTAKFAYVVRLLDADLESSLESGLGLVLRDGAWAVEDALQEYRLGLNWYLAGFNQMIALDVAWLRAEFRGLGRNEVLEVLGLDPATSDEEFARGPSDENDVRMRVMYQFVF